MSKLTAPLLLACSVAAVAEGRHYSQLSTWQPRVTMPAADVLSGDFWPTSPSVPVDYSGPGFAEERLSAVPAHGGEGQSRGWLEVARCLGGGAALPRRRFLTSPWPCTQTQAPRKT